jgi:hypothetical protein
MPAIRAMSANAQPDGALMRRRRSRPWGRGWTYRLRVSPPLSPAAELACLSCA